jgi:DNA-binding transcriptional MerR regulator
MTVDAAQRQPVIMTAEEVATMLRRSQNTLRYWRVSGVGPRYWRSRGRVFYDRADVDAWLDAERRGTVR